MRLKIDFHVHTCYSHDSSTSLKQVVAFAKKRRLDGIAITDHNTLKGALKLKTHEIIVIPGIEVSTLQGHLLGINVTTSISPQRDIEETIQKIHEAGGIAVAPHPFSFYKSPPSRSIGCYDAVEVMNASSIPFSLLTYYSKRFAERLNIPQTGGSDSHYAPEIGSAYTVIESESDVDEIGCALKRGNTLPIGHGVPWKTRLERTAQALKRKI